MPTQTIQVSSTVRFEATGPDQTTVAVTNLGPDSCYYATAATVSSGSNDGTLAIGAVLSFLPSKFFISAGTSRLQVVTPAFPDLARSFDPNGLTLGEESLPRALCGGTVSMTSQTLRLGYFTARKSETINNIRFSVAGTPAAATPSLIRYAVYSVASSNSDLTLVASTANDTTLLAVANTGYTKATSAPFAKVAGVRYALGLLVVTATTVPIIPGAALPAADGLLAPKLYSSLAAQADLPATIADSTLTTLATAGIYGVVLP